MNNSNKILLTAGLLSGTALGLLFAPQKGIETRKKLARDLKKMSAMLDGPCGREQLTVIKQKLEKHRSNLDTYLKKIDAKLARAEKQDLKTTV